MVGTSGVGDVRCAKVTYDWSIPNFSDHYEQSTGRDYLESSEFSSNNQTYWKLRLYLNGSKEKYKDYFSVFIYNCSYRSVTASVSISVINRKNEEVVRETLEKYEFMPSFDPTRDHWGFREFIERDFVMNRNKPILSNESLTIRCKVSLNLERNEAIKKLNLLKKRNSCHAVINLPRLRKIRKLECLMNDKDYTDVSFIVDGRKFEAHKCVVAKVSPVFDAMFKSDMREKQLNEVTIVDIRAEVFEEMLRYVYIGEVNDIKTIAGELLAAADKYAMNELKHMCAKSLLENLSVRNAVDSLLIVDRHCMNEFKAVIIDFISRHSTDIVGDPSFKLLAVLPSVLLEVSVAIGNKK